MKKKTVLALALAMSMGMTACGGSAATSEAAKEESAAASEAAEETTEETAEADDANESINIYIGGTIFEESMDPVKGFMGYGYGFVNEALLEVNQDSEYIPRLATDWEISEDALTYTFHLQEGIKFSDGSDFTAEDVAFTYQQVMENQANNENVDLTRLKSVETDGDYTVIFKLKEPYSPFLDATALQQIVPSDAYDSEAFDTAPIGTGAYKVTQYDANQQIILQVNETYWDGTPDIEQVNIISMDQDTAYSNAVSGQMDVVMVSSTYINEEIPGMNLQKLETMDVRNISLPTVEPQTMKDSEGNEVEVGNAVTSDVAVRKALSIGIDRQQIINNALNGEGKPSVNFTDNLVWASTDTYEDNQVEEAKKVLEDAGWTDEDNDGIREKDGQACSFEIIAPGSDEDRYKLATALAENAKELGIEIVVKNLPWDEARPAAYTTPVVWGWGQYSPTVISQTYYSKNYLTLRNGDVSGLNNAECDAAIEKALNATNQEDAVKAWKEAQEIGDSEYPYLYVVNIEHSYFINDNLDISLDTQIPHPHGHGSPIICNLKDWTLN